LRTYVSVTKSETFDATAGGQTIFEVPFVAEKQQAQNLRRRLSFYTAPSDQCSYQLPTSLPRLFDLTNRSGPLRLRFFFKYPISFAQALNSGRSGATLWNSFRVFGRG